MLVNLEPLAAFSASKIVKNSLSSTKITASNVENIVTKSLGVLTEQGIYAFGLFLATRKNEEHFIAVKIDEVFRELLKETIFLTSELDYGNDSALEDSKDTAEFYRDLTAQNNQIGESSVDALRRILLIKQIFEITLTYARYAAKAAK